jgi:N-acetylglucosamine-6-phosphate deacetylase
MLVFGGVFSTQVKNLIDEGRLCAFPGAVSTACRNQYLHLRTLPTGIFPPVGEESGMFRIQGDIVTPDAIIKCGRLLVNDAGEIAEISRSVGEDQAGRPRTGVVPRKAADIDAGGCWVLPGFIDMHVHGGGGADFMDATVDAVSAVARTHARYGTTALLATTLTASKDATTNAIRAVRTVAEADRAPDEARLLGIHLEGPYICPGRRGAQPEAFIRPPDMAELGDWVEMSGGWIRQITMAPELPGARDLVAFATGQGVLVSLGHTDATAGDVLAAVDCGARQATHVFNAMRGIHHREPGAAGAALALPAITVELIADGVHVHPLIVKLVLASKGAGGVVLITDAIEGAGMPEGRYSLGGVPVHVKGGAAAFADGTLAGSVLTMNRAFCNVMEFAGVSPLVASSVASANAARQLGVGDRFGSLEPGKMADIVIIDPATGDVRWTIIGGQTAYRR